MARAPDVIVRDGPPLSADSDAPLVPATPAPPLNASNDVTDQETGTSREVGPNNPADAPPADQQQQQQNDQGQQQIDQQHQASADDVTLENDADGNPKYPDNTPPWMKREITKSRNMQRAAEQTAADASRQLTETRGEIAKLTDQVRDLTAKITTPPAPADAPTAFAVPRPVREGFPDPDAYEAALIAWGEAKSAHETEARITAERQAAERQAEIDRAAEAEKQARAEAEAVLTELTTAHNKRRDAAIAEIPDYVTVAENPDMALSVPMAHAIFMAENGPQIAYHLGKNSAERERILGIKNIGQQIFEMGALSARLAGQPRVDVSRTPAPIRPIAPGGNSADNTADQEPSMDEWGASRTKQIQSERRPLIQSSDSRH